MATGKTNNANRVAALPIKTVGDPRGAGCCGQTVKYTWRIHHWSPDACEIMLSAAITRFTKRGIAAEVKEWSPHNTLMATKVKSILRAVYAGLDYGSPNRRRRDFGNRTWVMEDGIPKIRRKQLRISDY